ncbi:hypothetical protein Halar_2541 [halophilic archaeon DL31]|jgi:hypothetical protein|nr:hypothetical protein Halar_2541 [halophilic archaeon DL31]
MTRFEIATCKASFYLFSPALFLVGRFERDSLYRNILVSFSKESACSAR